MKHGGLLLALVAGAAVAAESWQVVSPDGKNEIRLTGGKALRIEVRRGGKTLLSPTRIGMQFENVGWLGDAPRFQREESRALDETIPTPLYKKSQIRNRAHEKLICFEGNFAVRLHAADDGVAYRFETSLGDGRVKVLDERCDLTLPSPETRLVAGHDAGCHADDPLQHSYESSYEEMPVRKFCPHALLPLEARKKQSWADREYGHVVYLPMLAMPEGGAMGIAESDVLDYAGLSFTRRAGEKENVLVATLAKWPVKEKEQRITVFWWVHDRRPWIVETAATRTYPWRIFTLADTVEKLVESDRVFALATPNRLGDVSWVVPGRVPWDWMSDLMLTGVDFVAGKNTATYLYYVDFAAEHDFKWVCLDGGWAKDMSAREPNPNLDLAAVCARAKARGVRLILWADWAELTDGRAEPLFKKYAEMGVHGFKIDYFDRDDAEVMRWMAETAELAAKYHLAIAYHGTFPPKGLQRTYPNILNHEGCRGMEQVLWTDRERMYWHARNDVYTAQVRMIAGFLDYTPGAMRNFSEWQYNPSRSLPGSMTSRCHQLAMGVCYEAPLQMYCATPSEYLANPACLRLIQSIPTVWDETVGVAGELGKWAALARRSERTWFLGVLNDERERTVEIPTSFLGAGAYVAECFLDGVNALRSPEDYRIVKKQVKPGEALKLPLARRGGAVVRFTAQ